MINRRRRRPDDWVSSHARARSTISDQLDGAVDADDARWLEGHLQTCADCRAAAAGYDADRTRLRALRAAAPVPPRDLWARTSAAIERESRFRDRRAASRPRRTFASTPAVLVTALVAAVVVGTLTSSRLPGGDRPTATASDGAVALASSSEAVGPDGTPIPVGGQVRYVSQGVDGRYVVRTVDVKAVCRGSAAGCSPAPAVEDQSVALTTQPRTVFGSGNADQLIVVDQPAPGEATTISVVSVEPTHASADPAPTATPEPTTAASVAITLSPVPTAIATDSAPPSAAGSAIPARSASPQPPSSPAVPTPTVAPSPTRTASVEPSTEPSFASVIPVSPSPTADGSLLIAENVVLVGQSAAYSANGEWFAFTARPADRSAGPDIYVWRVGDREARAVTSDHRSTFGSWLGRDVVVASRVVDVADTGSKTGVRQEPVSYLLDPRTGRQVPEPQTGRAWRPSVDPSGHRAIYWTGTLRPATDAPVFVPDTGRLVVGDWDTGTAASGSPLPKPRDPDQAEERHETTIAAGRVADWDARWDPTGSKVAVWIADPQNPEVGRLSLYAVDPFDGRIDLHRPLLDAVPATAGFSISAGKLVWAAPATDGSESGGRILVLAWTNDGVGTVETLPDKVVVIR